MAMVYTKEQQRVIDERDKNILVSAAAGSGKTAVLTDRIISLITDENRPMDVDHILVLTFTNAAAAEMRERIDKAIGKKLADNPEDPNLQRQKLLIQNAQISTIHSFCLFVLHNNFGDIGLDPGFRIMDDAEGKLLLEDCLSDILEEYYKNSEDEDFVKLVECYASDVNEGPLEDTILSIYKFVLSLVNPEKWIEDACRDFMIKSVSEFEDCGWWKIGTLSLIDGMIDDAIGLSERGMEVSAENDGPKNSFNGFEDYYHLFKKLKNNNDYVSRRNALQEASISKFTDTRKADPELKAMGRFYKETLKWCFDLLKSTYYLTDAEEFISDNLKMSGVASKLLEIVRLLYRRFDDYKRANNIIDFSDMEHLTLKILTDEDGNPTNAANEYKEYFEAVMVDEYQDINDVQESILKSVARDNNYFMVGDVKQSIYKFRQAKPEIFIGKYNTFTDDGPDTRIELNKNFRSKEEVLVFVNRIFERIMRKSTSKIDYDDSASLKYGAGCYTEDADISYKPEVLLIEKADDESTKRLGLIPDPRGAEAMLVANKINELVASGIRIFDKEEGEYRKLSYKHIVILLFSVSTNGDVYRKTLESQGIPVISESKSGYFDTKEIREILTLLEVINNPDDDIALYGVLHGFFGGFSDEELAKVKAGTKERGLYKAVVNYISDENEPDDVRERLSLFIDKINRYRYMTTYMGVRELLDDIVMSSGYISYVSSKKGGIQKKANVLLLLEKASDYERTSYRGLFRFIKYIQKIKEKDADFGEAMVLDENEDAVRIMTIHKSKGLEYPVCFLCASDSLLKNRTASASVVLDKDYGVALDLVDPVRRIKKKAFKKTVLTKNIGFENLSEQLRVLYVALTRAREKLYITGTVSRTKKDIDEGRTLEEVFVSKQVPYGKLSDLSILSLNSYLDMISTAICSAGHVDEYYRFYTCDELISNNITETIKTGLTKEYIISSKDNTDEAFEEMIEGRLSYKYQYEYLKNLKTKVSVSELKKHAIEMKNEDTVDTTDSDEPVIPAKDEKGNIIFDSSNEMENRGISHNENDKFIPEFIKGSKENQTEKVPKSLVGSAYHRLMELIDYKEIGLKYPDGISKDDIDFVVDNTIKVNKVNGKLSEEYADIITGSGAGMNIKEKVRLFFDSDLSKGMIKAAVNDKLYREKSFFMGISAKEVSSEYPEEEEVLIQGIIDVFYENEDGTIVLADYKTDSLKKIALNGGYFSGENAAKTEEEKLTALKERYRVQLELYARAIERITDKKVSKIIIYSFDLDRETIM